MPSGGPAAAGPQAPAEGPATILVGDTRYTHVVKRHDTLSKIARQWLGDPNRWPEICRLNKHRHFPTVGGVLRDCDLIYPGWELRLPVDASPPADASPQPGRPRERTPQPTPPASAPVDPDGVVEQPPATPPAPPAQTPPESDAAPAPSTATEDGIELPGGYLPWGLATAITAAAALAWLQRRRRWRPGDTTGTDLPEPVAEVRREVLRRPAADVPSDLAQRAAAVPDLPWPPPGGVGLVGDGAHAAARAALVAALASGGPADPDRRSEVITDRPTWTALFGTDPGDGWPRLHIAGSPEQALTELDARLLHRARILDEHGVADLADLREQAPAEEAVPPILLLGHTPPAAAEHRLRIGLGLGAGQDVTAVLLGSWQAGTVDVAADGRTNAGAGERVAVLDAPTALVALATLREAHTGEPTAQSAPAASTAPVAPPLDTAPATAPAVPAAKVRLRVLGEPRVEDVTQPGRPLRAKAAELAVFLACHPDGADTATIAEHLTPDARLRAATQQVHTNASNLRHVLGRAGGPRPGGYLLKKGAASRYRLDPATIEIDLWQLRDLLGRARRTNPPQRTDLLRQACDLYTAPLADDCHYDWVEPHRETARRWATEAHLLLAEDLLPADPQAASDVLDKAIGLDRYNEELYRAAMRARHALGDADGVRALLRALIKALHDLDAEPEPATADLAARLLATRRDQAART
jgi:DNA-binding SARP family transcriptional activator